MNIIITDFKLFNLLKPLLGEEKAQEFVSGLEVAVDKKFGDKKDALVAEIETKIAQSETRLTTRFSNALGVQTIIIIISLFGFLELFVK